MCNELVMSEGSRNLARKVGLREKLSESCQYIHVRSKRGAVTGNRDYQKGFNVLVVAMKRKHHLDK